MGASGCGDDNGDEAGTAGSTSSETEGTSDTTSDTDGTGAETDTSGTSAGSGTGTATTGSPGELEGLLTFTFYPADAEIPEDLLGLAGAWREGGFPGLEDLFGLYGLSHTFPPPPAAEDALEHNDIPVPFDWGSPATWIAAGNGMKLLSGETEAVACLRWVDDDYPLYVAADSPNLDPACSPRPAAFLPGTGYDLILYGGSQFEDLRLNGQVRTPAALEVTAPDVSMYNLAVDPNDGLAVQWSGDAADGTRVVIRVWDQYGRMLTVHAADDGEYTIPGADLDMLTPGPAWLTVARERLTRVGFSDGSIKVVTRYEVWGYLDLL